MPPPPPGQSAPGESIEWSSDFVPERALARATGSPRVDGNRIFLQFEGPSAFDRWIEVIGQATRYIHFENYIVRNDPQGLRFRDALVERARAGVSVRVLYDWVGCWATSRRFWRPLREAGVEVRAFNRPTFRDPFGILQRDHRKLVAVDGRVAFIGGFCVGQEWVGTDTEPPWRDTGVEIHGPAAAAAARSFQRIWAEIGDPVPDEIEADPDGSDGEGTTPVWLIEGLPWRTRVYRVTQLMAAHARRRIWITDPYFVAPRAVREALAGAARDGVDVRVLVPAHNNWPWVGSLSRGGYRPLLEAGVRIFEWEGPMIHAKTAVIDDYWCRVGSSNLNAASLLGNWELDVGVVDRDLAEQVAGLFMADLASAVEILLPADFRTREREDRDREDRDRAERDRADRSGIAGRGVSTLDEAPDMGTRWRSWARNPTGGHTLTLADLVRAGSSLGEAIAGHRVVGREDRAVIAALATALLAAAALAIVFPRLVAWTLAGLMVWTGGALVIRGMLQYRRARRELRDRRRRRRREAEHGGEA